MKKFICFAVTMVLVLCLSACGTPVDELRQQITNLKNGNATLTEMLEDLENKNSDLNSKIDQLNDENQVLSDKADGLEKELESIKNPDFLLTIFAETTFMRQGGSGTDIKVDYMLQNFGEPVTIAIWGFWRPYIPGAEHTAYYEMPAEPTFIHIETGGAIRGSFTAGQELNLKTLEAGVHELIFFAHFFLNFDESDRRTWNIASEENFVGIISNKIAITVVDYLID